MRRQNVAAANGQQPVIARCIAKHAVMLADQSHQPLWERLHACNSVPAAQQYRRQRQCGGGRFRSAASGVLRLSAAVEVAFPLLHFAIAKLRRAAGC